MSLRLCVSWGSLSVSLGWRWSRHLSGNGAWACYLHLCILRIFICRNVPFSFLLHDHCRLKITVVMGNVSQINSLESPKRKLKFSSRCQIRHRVAHYCACWPSALGLFPVVGKVAGTHTLPAVMVLEDCPGWKRLSLSFPSLRKRTKLPEPCQNSLESSWPALFHVWNWKLTDILSSPGLPGRSRWLLALRKVTGTISGCGHEKDTFPCKLKAKKRSISKSVRVAILFN